MSNPTGMAKWDERRKQLGQQTPQTEEAPPRPVGRPPRPDRTKNVMFIINEVLLAQLDEIIDAQKAAYYSWSPQVSNEQLIESKNIAATKGVAAANEYLQSVNPRPKLPSRNGLLNQIVEEWLLRRNKDHDDQVRKAE